MGSREILVVEDDLVTQNMIKTTLTNAGYQVFTASTGKEAIELAQKKLPEVVVLDIMMPDMDGGEIAETLRNDPKLAKTPIIFLSALVTGKEERVSSQKLPTVFMSKPFNRERLLNEIRKFIKPRD
jgi:CheY-like chemotaxis protein